MALKHRSALVTLVLASSLAFFGITIVRSRDAQNDSTLQPNPEIAQILLGVAKDYRSFGLVDDVLRWAPTLCAQPRPARIRISESGDLLSHGRKLYSLFARYPLEYAARGKTAPVTPSRFGQAIVKESWEPVEMLPGEELPDVWGRSILKGDVIDPYASERGLHGQLRRTVEQGGKHYRMGRKSALFVMAKVSSNMAGTDQGWIYGTLDPSGTTVTSGGRIEMCMACHVRAASDRLFGLRP